MNKKVILIVLAIVIVFIGIPAGSYNSLVSQQTAVEQQQANIDTQLQRRADLIPNLVNTVKKFTDHETEVFDSVNKAREHLLAAGTMAEKSAANDEVSSALGRLLAIAEAYPNLKSDTVYTNLMDELAGTENRISYARRDYNTVVTEYNQSIRSFPKNIFAGMFGFEKADFFKAKEGAENAPVVKFE